MSGDKSLPLRHTFWRGALVVSPFSLGSGQPAFARDAVKADLALVIRAGREAGIPVIVGAVGTAGSDAQGDWALDIVREIVAERRHF